MAISRFQSRFKTRPDLMDNITPNNVVQMNASVPAGEWKPASWLPVVWQNDRSKDYFVISSGKVVSFDASGRIVPSGLIRLAEATANNAAFITYTSEDEAARVVGVDGDFVQAGDSLSLEQFCNAVSDRGWMPGVAKPGADDAACRDFVRSFISAPVGVAAYDVYVWAGDDPANLHFTNYQKQHLIQFFSDVQMRVAHVCDTVATAVELNNGHPAVGTIVDADSLSRYSGLPNVADIVAYDTGLGKVASHTSRTPFSIDKFVGRLRKDPAMLAKDGDYFLDADAGIVLFYKQNGGGAPSDVNARALANGDIISVFDYSAAASSDERMMHLVGDARPGDFVTFDAHSNFVVRSNSIDLTGADADDSAAILALLQQREDYTVGRVYELQKEPRGLLERVKTGWSGDEFDASSKMPGSATEGFSDLITLSENKIADEIAIINVKMK